MQHDRHDAQSRVLTAVNSRFQDSTCAVSSMKVDLDRLMGGGCQKEDAGFKEVPLMF